MANNFTDNTNINKVQNKEVNHSRTEILSRRQEQEEKRLRQRFYIMIVFVIIIIILAFAMINIIRSEYKPKPQLYILVPGNLEKNIESKSLVLRDEIQLEASSSGLMAAGVTSGEKIAVNDPVAKIVDLQAEQQREELAEVNEEISERQLELLNDHNLPDDGLVERIYSKYDIQLSEYIKTLQDIANDKLPIDNTAMIQEELSLKLKERSENLNTLDFEDETIINLKNKKANLESYLKDYETPIISKKSGYVSYLIDEYSRKITEEDIDKIDPETILNANIDVHKEKNMLKQNLSKGQSALSLITSFDQRLVVPVDRAMAAEFEIDNIYDLKFPRENLELNAVKLISVKEQGEYALLTFYTSQKIGDFADLRYIPVSMKIESVRGLKIPQSAIVRSKEGNKAAVMVLRRAYVYEQEIEILAEDDEYAIIANKENSDIELTDGSVIVQNPETVRNGEKLMS